MIHSWAQTQTSQKPEMNIIGKYLFCSFSGEIIVSQQSCAYQEEEKEDYMAVST